MDDSELFEELTACFQAAVGAYHTTEMRNAGTNEKRRGVVDCAAELFEQTTGQTSLDLTDSQERSLKRALLAVAGPPGKNQWVGGVDAADIVQARDEIFNDALKAGLIKRGPSDFL